jgi:hypothetical protein
LTQVHNMHREETGKERLRINLEEDWDFLRASGGFL